MKERGEREERGTLVWAKRSWEVSHERRAKGGRGAGWKEREKEKAEVELARKRKYGKKWRSELFQKKN